MSKIKVGQVYKFHNLTYAVCFVDLNFATKQQVQVITPKGFTYSWSYKKVDRYCGCLIAEYPTWQEAVNSKEFNNVAED